MLGSFPGPTLLAVVLTPEVKTWRQELAMALILP